MIKFVLSVFRGITNLSNVRHSTLYNLSIEDDVRATTPGRGPGTYLCVNVSRRTNRWRPYLLSACVLSLGKEAPVNEKEAPVNEKEVHTLHSPRHLRSSGSDGAGRVPPCEGGPPEERTGKESGISEAGSCPRTRFKKGPLCPRSGLRNQYCESLHLYTKGDALLRSHSFVPTLLGSALLLCRSRVRSGSLSTKTVGGVGTVKTPSNFEGF